MKPIIFRWSILFTLTLFLVGCRTHNMSMLMQNYMLEDSALAADQKIAAPAFPGVLKIRSCRAAAPFDSQHFLYKSAFGRYEQDFYKDFLTPPNEQMTELLGARMENTGLFSNVLPASSGVNPDYILEPQLLAIYADFSDEMNPQTVIKLHFVLIQLDKVRQNSTIVLEKTYQRSETFQEKTGNAIISGYNAGLQAIFTQLAEDIRAKAQ